MYARSRLIFYIEIINGHFNMKQNLNQIEKDFVEFMSGKKKRHYEVMEKLYLRTREEFKFQGPKYEKLSGIIIRLLRMMYDITDEHSAVEAYQAFAYLHLLRYLTYSYPKAKSDYLYETYKLIKKGRFKDIFIFSKRKVAGRFKPQKAEIAYSPQNLARSLIGKIESPPVVVDYGCGLGYISMEIAKLNEKAKIFLLDIEGLVLEFAGFRFKKHGINVEFIPVSKSNPYPKLPRHNICLATEVMEHVCQPLKAYRNIHDAMESGGILYGNFEDHEKGIFHVSPLLKDLREKIVRDFQPVGLRCYKKIK